MIRWGGITISFHPLFVIIMLASVITGHFVELITLFAIVFIHEWGHVAAARWFGVNVVSVQMLPFGGVAVMEDTTFLNAGREMLIAVAGPFQNGLLIGLAWLLHAFGLWDGPFYEYFVQGNILIALFNLLPVLPLDGGKIAHSLFSIILPYHLSLVWSLRISLLFSLFVIGYALSPLLLQNGVLQLNLLLIGSFLLYSNYVDYRNIPYRFMRFLMNRDRSFSHHLLHGSLAQPIVADKVQPLEHILRLFKRDKYHLIYVMNRQGKIIAVLPEQKVIYSFLKGGPAA